MDERFENLVFPGEVLLLLKTMTYTELDVEWRNSAQRAVSKKATQYELRLIMRKGVMLGCHQHFIALFDLERVPFAVRREHDVVWSAGEVMISRSAFEFEVQPLLR